MEIFQIAIFFSMKIHNIVFMNEEKNVFLAQSWKSFMAYHDEIEIAFTFFENTRGYSLGNLINKLQK